MRAIFFLAPFFMAAILSFVALKAQARGDIYYTCKAPDGQVSYRDFCNPEDEVLGEHRAGEKRGDKGETAQISVVLYVVDDCEACDSVAEFFAIRKISVQKKDVADPAVLDEFRSVYSGGTIPVTKIADKIAIGYERSELLKLLEEAGYKDPENQQEENSN